MYWEEEEMMTEYAVHSKSSDGKEEHITGHFTKIEDAMASASRKMACNHRDVYIVTRMVTEWRHIVPHKKGEQR